uniref:Transmembrane protein 74 n=1 Tax=Naja naja TaxID=35670 RepID=A0A8C6XB99_NAJNA
MISQQRLGDGIPGSAALSPPPPPGMLRFPLDKHLDPGLAHHSCCQDQEFLPHPDPDTEMPSEWPYDPASLISEEEDDDGSEAAGGKSVDYSFISAILFLVIGILLVIVSYVVPRGVTVDPSTVAAREMERLEKKSARIGAHLDRCVIAGLLMMQMWKGELYRRNRFAASKESAKLYGSFNFRVKSSTSDNMELSLVEEEALAVTKTSYGEFPSM